MALPTVLDLASNQTSLRVQFSQEPEHAPPILDQILPFLGCAGTNCEINDYVLPMATHPYFTLAPSIESVLSRWTPWDTDLSTDYRYHLLVTNVELYGRMVEHSARHGHSIVLSASADPAHNSVVHVEIHLLNQTEVVELLARLYREMRNNKTEIETLRRELNELRNRFGTALENLAAWREELAPVLGLTQPHPNVPPADDGPA